MKLSAAELHRRGRAHLNAGQNAAARRVLQLAAQRTDDADLRARIAGSLAAVTIRQGDPDAAEQLCREALARAGVSDATAAILYGQLGLLALEKGVLEEAIALLDRGIRGIGSEAEFRAPMLVNRSVAHCQAGRLRQARADVEAAAAAYQTVGGEVERAMALHNAGYISLLEGDLIAALETMGRARGALASASAVNAAICDLDRAEVLRDAGLAREAELGLERVIAVFAANRMRQAKGEAQFHLARSLLAHSPDRAAATAATAARTFRAVDSQWWALRAEAVRLRGLLVPEDEQATAPPGILAEAEAIAAAMQGRGLRSEAATLRLTAELSRARQPGAPQPRPAVRAPRQAPLPERLLAHEVRAARAAARGEESLARRHAALGLDELAQWQRSFGSLDLATSLVMHGGGLIFAGLRSAVRSWRPDIAFEWSERARQLGQQAIAVRPPRDEGLAADLAELRMLRKDWGADDFLSNPRVAELSERVRSRQWSASSAHEFRERVSLQQLRATLTADTAVVSYLYDGTGVAAVAAGRAAARMVDLGPWTRIRPVLAGLRADLDVSAAVRSGPLAPSVAASLEERLAEISAILVDPLRTSIAERLVITVPGILGGIPWGMLPALRGRPITIAASASQWSAAGREHPGTAPDVGLVAGPRVARAMEEVSRAASAWRAATVLGPAAATVEATGRLAAGVGTLHIAAHGRHAADNPLFSGVELSDGTLFGYDLDLIAPVPQTVVLSACELGRSSVRWGEEAIGMTRAWLHAGARCVVASPAVVADDVACELLAAMHTGLAAGMEVSEALCRAADATGIVAPFQAHGAGFSPRPPGRARLTQPGGGAGAARAGCGPPVQRWDRPPSG